MCLISVDGMFKVTKCGDTLAQMDLHLKYQFYPDSFSWAIFLGVTMKYTGLNGSSFQTKSSKCVIEIPNMPRQQFGFVDVVLKAAAIEGAPVKALSVIIGHK